MEDGISHGDIPACRKGCPVFTGDEALLGYVSFCFKCNVFAQDAPQVDHIISLQDHRISEDGGVILQCLFRLRHQSIGADQAAVRRESHGLRLQVYLRIEDFIGLSMNGDHGRFQPDHVTGKACHLFFGKRNAWLQAILFCIGYAGIHQGLVFFFIVRIAIDVPHARKACDLLSHQFLFIESVSQPFGDPIRVPGHLSVHVV
ncbi:hypothetical protein [uncultured Dialister sp.]|uniref:hypothetical protein n=1 Tax=uncultured Dialister sp. TaxID=278064 RepID=UPI0025DBD247|nr:hypothetical protein [uncultured Dialister sp.]